MDEESLLTDEVLALVGKTAELESVVVKAADAGRMRAILGDADPRYAEGTGIAPHYMLAVLAAATQPQTPRLMPNGILTQQEWRFTRPFREGEVLRAVWQLADIRERLGGRYGHSLLLTTTTDYYDAGGGHVAASQLTITQFDASRAQGSDQ